MFAENPKLDEKIYKFNLKLNEYFTSEIVIPQDCYKKMIKLKLVRSTELVERLCQLLCIKKKRYSD